MQELTLMQGRSSVKRIFIIGGPGSGKTTLARKLAAITDAPIHELDLVGYENGAGAKRALPDKLRDVETIAESEKWIAEGVFLWWTERLAEQADMVIWLDVPWHLAWWRIVSRHVKTSISRTNRHRGWRKLRYFLQNARRYYTGKESRPESIDDDRTVTRDATELELARHRHKLVHCRNTRDVAAIVRLLSLLSC